MKKKVLFFANFIVIFSFILINIFNIVSFASTPKLVSKLEKAFENIESWILKLSTPAAAVAVGTGIFMKKFSFGDEERIRTRKENN